MLGARLPWKLSSEMRRVVSTCSQNQKGWLERNFRSSSRAGHSHKPGDCRVSFGLVVNYLSYDRSPDYDPEVDSIVRTEARRLRKKLHEYYEGDGGNSQVRITIPTGGYI